MGVQLPWGLYAKTATEAFDRTWDELYAMRNRGFLQPSRAGDVVGEIINATIVIEDPTRGIVQSPIRNMPMRYALGELAWYLSASNRVSDISKFSSFWENITDDGETLNSAYGHRIHNKFGFDQWEWVKSKLSVNSLDRQAVIHIKEADDTPTKDTPCTVMFQFQIREGLLYMTTYMRSNDIWKGFPYDVFAFTFFQMKMAMELGVGLGCYTHHVGSLHLYKGDAEGWEQKQNGKSK